MRNWATSLVDDWRAGDTAADGAPHPPRRLIRRITGALPKRGFYKSGEIQARELNRILEAHQLGIEKFESILDFGSGAGRMIRHLKRGQSRVYGVDPDRECIDWCRRALGHLAEFYCNDTLSPLPIEDGVIAFVLANSVFTHLDNEDFDYWIGEIARVTRPGGVAYITLNGAARAADEYPVALSQQERRAFDSGERVVVNPHRSGDNRFVGRNQCYNYIPAVCAQNIFQGHFQILAFTPGNRPLRQDVYLLQRK